MKDENTLGLYSPDGGTSGEFNIRWEMVGDHWTPKINIEGVPISQSN